MAVAIGLGRKAMPFCILLIADGSRAGSIVLCLSAQG